MLINLIRKLNVLTKNLSPAPRNSRVKPQGDDCKDRASSRFHRAPTKNTQVWVRSLSRSYACLRLRRTPAVTEPRSPGSSPVLLFWVVFLLVQPALVPVWAQSCSAAIALGSDTAFKPPIPQTRGWLLFTGMTRSGSCVLIVASKQSELEATLLSTLQMLSKKTVAMRLAQASHCGMRWRMFPGKLRVLPCFTGVETGCGKGWCASQRTCLLSPSPRCWTLRLSVPPNIMSSYVIPSWQGNGELAMSWGFFSCCSNP